MLLFFAGGSRKKSYEVSKFGGGGGGGGGGVYALNEFFEKIHNIYKKKILQLADNIIQFVVSIGFLCVRRYGLSQLSAHSAILYYYLYGN